MFMERGVFVLSKIYILDHLHCKLDEWKPETISSLHVAVLFDLHLYLYLHYHCVYAYFKLSHHLKNISYLPNFQVTHKYEVAKISNLSSAIKVSENICSSQRKHIKK